MTILHRPEVAERNRFSLDSKSFDADIARISSRRRGAALNSAIRNNAQGYIDVLAAEASNGEYDTWLSLVDFILKAYAEIGLEQLQQRLFGGSQAKEFKPAPIGEIGMYISNTDVLEESDGVGELLMELSISALPKKLSSSKTIRRELFDAYFRLGEFEKAKVLLARSRDLPLEVRAAIECNLSHPLNSGEADGWAKKLSSAIFPDGDVEFSFIEGSGLPISRRLETRSEASCFGDSDGKIVSFYLYGDDKSGIEELDLSIEHLEKEFCENASAVICLNTFSDEMQHTIRSRYADKGFVSLAETVNKGLEGHSSAKFCSFLRAGMIVSRLAVSQMSVATARDGACRLAVASTVIADERGFLSVGENRNYGFEGVLVCPSELLVACGGFISSKRYFVDEFLSRVQAIEPEMIIESSQFRAADFRPWARIQLGQQIQKSTEYRALRSSFEFFHQNAPGHELRDRASIARGVSVPANFQESPVRDTDFDVIIAGDWRKYGGPQKSMIEEIRALSSAGKRVAVLHLEASRFMDRDLLNLNVEIQRMINRGEVNEVFYHQPACAKLMILRYPPILQIASDAPTKLEMKHLWVLANQAPSELDGLDIRYRVPDCTTNARRNFSKNVVWVPQGPQVRDAIEPYLHSDEIKPFNIPGIVDLDEWETQVPRESFADKPIVGRHSRDNVMKWPENPAVLEELYPTDGLFDVRMMGGSRTALSILGRKEVPSGWTDYPKDYLPVKEFLAQLEYYVFYQNSNAIEAFGRAILEAIAANLVVILPEHYKRVFGDAAVYASPWEVRSLIERFSASPDLYAEQQAKALAVLKSQFTYEAYVKLIESELESIGDRLP